MNDSIFVQEIYNDSDNCDFGFDIKCDKTEKQIKLLQLVKNIRKECVTGVAGYDKIVRMIDEVLNEQR